METTKVPGAGAPTAPVTAEEIRAAARRLEAANAERDAAASALRKLEAAAPDLYERVTGRGTRPVVQT